MSTLKDFRKEKDEMLVKSPESPFRKNKRNISPD